MQTFSDESDNDNLSSDDYSISESEQEESESDDSSDTIMDIPTRLQRCLRQYNEHNYESAAYHAQIILSANPEHIEALRIRSKLLIRGENYIAALTDLNQIIQSFPNDLDALLDRSEIYLTDKNEDAALEDLTKVLSINPAHQPSLLSRAEIYATKNILNKAIVDLTSVIDLDPTLIKARLTRAQLNFRSSNTQASLLDLNYILSNTSRVPARERAQACSIRMKIFFMNNELDHALSDAEIVIHNNDVLGCPGQERTDAHTLIVKIVSQQPCKQSSINLLTKIINQNPDHLDALLLRTQIYKTLGETELVLQGERLAHQLMLKLGGNRLPTLSQFCKMTIYKHEPSIYASGKMLEINPIVMRFVLAQNDITPTSIDNMRRAFDGKNYNDKSRNIFDQLDMAATAASIMRHTTQQIAQLRQELISKYESTPANPALPESAETTKKSTKRTLSTEELRARRIQFFSSTQEDTAPARKRQKTDNPNSKIS